MKKEEKKFNSTKESNGMFSLPGLWDAPSSLGDIYDTGGLAMGHVIALEAGLWPCPIHVNLMII